MYLDNLSSVFKVLGFESEISLSTKSIILHSFTISLKFLSPKFYYSLYYIYYAFNNHYNLSAIYKTSKDVLMYEDEL
jgi:hypothetical protein